MQAIFSVLRLMRNSAHNGKWSVGVQLKLPAGLIDIQKSSSEDICKPGLGGGQSGPLYFDEGAWANARNDHAMGCSGYLCAVNAKGWTALSAGMALLLLLTGCRISAPVPDSSEPSPSQETLRRQIEAPEISEEFNLPSSISDLKEALNPTATLAAQPTPESGFRREKIEDGQGLWPFVALNDPEFVAPDEVTFLQPLDLVLGFSFNGESKAYPTSMMWFHHVANDSVGGKPVAITY